MLLEIDKDASRPRLHIRTPVVSCPVLSFLSHPSPEPTFRDEDDEVNRSLNIYIMLPQLNWFSLLIRGFLSLASFDLKVWELGILLLKDPFPSVFTTNGVFVWSLVIVIIHCKFCL